MWSAYSALVSMRTGNPIFGLLLLHLRSPVSEWVFNDSRSAISRCVSGGSDNFDIVSDIGATAPSSIPHREQGAFDSLG